MSYDDLARRVIDAGGSLAPAPRGLVRLVGPDAAVFLHRLSSQDITGMRPGEVRPAAFLNAKGRLLMTCEVAMLEASVDLSTQLHLAAPLAELLERFHFAEQLTVEGPLDLPCGAVFTVAATAAPAAVGCAALPGGGVELSGVRAGVHWVRRHAPAADLAEWLASAPPRLPADGAAALRFVLREPLVGSDSEANTLALELPIDDHISTTKGCYTGQEIVARIHTYGHTNRSLCLLGIATEAAIDPGTALVETGDGDAVGRVMTSAPLPGTASRLAFGFLPSMFTAVGTTLALGAAAGARVEVL